MDRGSQFSNRSMKSWLQDDDMERYSTCDEGKSVVAERFIRTLKSKIYKYVTLISKNVCIDKLYEIVNKYSNTYHSTIKIRLVNEKSSTYIDFNKKNNKENPKLKMVRISKYKTIFAKCYIPNWSEEVSVIKKIFSKA